MKGGLLASAFAVLFCPLALNFSVEYIFYVFYPVLTVVQMDMEMRYPPHGTAATVLYWTIGIALQLFLYFMLGSIIGLLVQKAEKRSLKIAITIITGVCIAGAMIITTLLESGGFVLS